jgi:hypothetical protein
MHFIQYIHAGNVPRSLSINHSFTSLSMSSAYAKAKRLDIYGKSISNETPELIAQKQTELRNGNRETLA